MPAATIVATGQPQAAYLGVPTVIRRAKSGQHLVKYARRDPGTTVFDAA